MCDIEKSSVETLWQEDDLTSPQETEAAMCDIGKSSVETLWQEDDLTSPTYKLVGEVSLDTSFRARANSLPGENARSFQPKTLDLMQERKKAAV
ncbi:hypothetical protein QE152_g34103 [Popillia japonica]|uniref:Uncharacterized protein n=1 Tax=Popillia japonica TaxID=7064 RepID=A0AAW1IUU6_POPJA